jgi:high-affinity iron transporter
MFLPFIITFREVLEIALIISLMFVATKGLENRSKWIGLGLLLGILGSFLIAVFIEGISNFANGLGQELFNGLIALSASILIGWTAVWVSSHGKEIAKSIKQKGLDVVAGKLPVKTIVFIIMLAVLREGSEIVLFSYGMILSGKTIATIVSGSVLGSIAGAIVGALLYFGMVKINTKYIFKITSYLLIFIAAGMAAVAGKFFAAAGYFSFGSNIVWDTSSILSQESVFGEILHMFFGYSDSPMMVEILFYGVFLLIIFASLRLIRIKNSRIS